MSDTLDQRRAPPAPRLQEKLRRCYAVLCASAAAPSKKGQRCENALREFGELCSLPHVQQVGVNPNKSELYLGTAMVELADRMGKIHCIGEFIITIGHRPHAYFTFANITQTIGGYHHPHISENGVMCMESGRDEILLDIAGGYLLPATRRILTALQTLSPHPYPNANIERWPLKMKRSIA